MRLPASLLLLALVAPPLAAQDQDYYGAAVAFAGRDLLVVKRAPARGPAAVYAYRPSGGTWTRLGELRAPGAVERGLALSPSIAASGDLVLVGAGDPADRWGAHAFTRTGAAWGAADDIAIGSPPAGDPEVSMATVMAILQPVPRQVATNGEVALVGFRDRVWVSARVNGAWRHTMADSSVSIGYRGGPVAMAKNTAVVSVSTDGGDVRVAEVGGMGWTALRPADLGPGSRFGTALAADAGTIAVAAPGAGVVVLFGRSADGRWSEAARIPAGGDTMVVVSALAVAGDDLLVGGAGTAVQHFHRMDGSWQAMAPLTPPTAASRAYGSALAVGPDGFAIGDQNAAGGRGRVWIFPRDQRVNVMPVELGPAATPPSMTAGEVRCTDDRAGEYACHDIDLSAFLSIESLGGTPTERVSDLWGWTDPETRREYALVGRTGALVFVDLTDASSPRVVGEMPAPASGARDIKVYRDHAFMTGDGAGQHGLMIFDLTRLRAARGTGTVFTPDTIYRGIASAHNLVIDTTDGFAIPVAATAGGNTCGGGLHIIDIRDPMAPTFRGCYTDTEGLVAPGRTHDAQCVGYRGPDTEHRGKPICFALNETALRIVDLSDPAAPVPLSASRFPGQAYIHQGWLTEDQRYFYLGDELDELVGTAGGRTRTLIWDVTDLDDPVLAGSYLGRDGATDHNLYVKGDRMYQANYQSGLSVIDISDPRAPREVGHFDTTPYEGNSAGFYGAWTAYPYYPSGQVVVSSMQEGLFILKPRPALVP
jgi:choice-of-anchor B domain-containing protein